MIVKGYEIKSGANLYGANLYGANLCGANLYGADLRGADLRGANLYGANLCEANLYGADLRGADLRGANLCEANLCGANLYGADLRGADLRGADLREADLRGADLSNIYFYCCIGNGREIKTLLCTNWHIILCGNILQIGCKKFTVAEWLDFSDDQINKMDHQALEWWKEWKPKLEILGFLTEIKT